MQSLGIKRNLGCSSGPKMCVTQTSLSSAEINSPHYEERRELSCRVYYFALVKKRTPGSTSPPQKGWVNAPSPSRRAGLPRYAPLCLTFSTPLSFLVVISSPCSSTVAVGFSPLLLVPSSVVIVSYKKKTCQKKGIFCSESIIS